VTGELRLDRETAMIERVERIKAREDSSSEETTVS